MRGAHDLQRAFQAIAGYHRPRRLDGLHVTRPEAAVPGGRALCWRQEAHALIAAYRLRALRLYESLGFVIYEEGEHGCWARLRLPNPALAGEE